MKIKNIKKILLASLALLLTSCSKYKVILVDFNNDNEIVSFKIKDHNDIKDIAIPLNEGYEFSGWYLDAEFKNEYNDKISINEIDFLYLKWEKIKYSFIEIYDKAYFNHLNSKKYIVDISGEAKAIIATQKIYSKKIVDNDYLYLFNASYGLAKAYIILETNDAHYTYERGVPNEDFGPNKTEFKKDVTLDEYISLFGVNPYELNYIVNEKTLLEIVNTKEDPDKYIYTVKLKDSAAINYKKYVNSMNNLESKNILFNEIEIEFIITKDFYFKQINYKEKYTIEVKLPIVGYIEQSVSNKIKEIYSYEKGE